MEDDIDIEEHDLLKDPALRSVFPDLGFLKCEVIDFGEVTGNTVEDPFEIENENQLDSTLEANSGNPPPVSSMQDLDVKPDVLCTDIDDTLTVANYNLSESEKVDFHIKKESENDESNDWLIYKNRIILGKINVDATDEKCNNDAPSYSDNVAKNEEITINEPDIEVAIDSDEDRSNRISKQYYEKENRLLVKIVLRDCYTSLLCNKCYCAQCRVLFPTTEAYSEHYMSTHTKTTYNNTTKASTALVTPKNIIYSGDKPFEFEICRKRFGRSRNLNKHIFIHNDIKRFGCETCKKRFRRKDHLKNHKLIHTGEKPFECETCKKTFRQKNNLDSHKLIHTGEKPFECETCKKTFRQKNNLDSHKLMHTGEKPFECETCKKTFRQKNNLESHKLMHTGEKPFECETCTKAFYRSIDLNKHKMIHTGEKPFECETCKKTFTQKRQLNSHKLIHTGAKSYE